MQKSFEYLFTHSYGYLTNKHIKTCAHVDLKNGQTSKYTIIRESKVLNYLVRESSQRKTLKFFENVISGKYFGGILGNKNFAMLLQLKGDFVFP